METARAWPSAHGDTIGHALCWQVGHWNPTPYSHSSPIQRLVSVATLALSLYRTSSRTLLVTSGVAVDLYKMFGLNLWARPFLPPPGGPSGPGMEGLAHMARPPTSLGSPPYLVPGLMDKSGPMIPPSSLLLYRPGEHLLHPSMLRLDHPNLPAMHAPAPERSSLHPPGLHNDDEPYPSAFVPAKRARIERPPGLPDDRRTPESRHAGSPMADGRCGSTGGSADNASPALSARSPLSGGRPSPELHGHTGKDLVNIHWVV